MPAVCGGISALPRPLLPTCNIALWAQPTPGLTVRAFLFSEQDALVSDLEFSMKVVANVPRLSKAVTSALQKHLHLPVSSLDIQVAESSTLLMGHQEPGAASPNSSPSPGQSALPLATTGTALDDDMLHRMYAAQGSKGKRRTLPRSLEVVAKFRTPIAPAEQGALFFTIATLPLPFLFTPPGCTSPLEFSTNDALVQHLQAEGAKPQLIAAARAALPRVRVSRAPQAEIAVSLSSVHVGASVAFDVDHLSLPELRAKFCGWTWDAFMPLTPAECGWAEEAEARSARATQVAGQLSGMGVVPNPPSLSSSLPVTVQSLAASDTPRKRNLWSWAFVSDAAVASARSPTSPDTQPEPAPGTAEELPMIGPTTLASALAASDMLSGEAGAGGAAAAQPGKDSARAAAVRVEPGSIDPHRVFTLSKELLEPLNIQGFDFPIAMYLTAAEVLSPVILATGITAAAQAVAAASTTSSWFTSKQHPAPFDILSFRIGPLGPPPLHMLPIETYTTGTPGEPNTAGQALLQLMDLVLEFEAVAAGEKHRCQLYLQRLQLPVASGGTPADAAAHITYRCVKVGTGSHFVSSDNVWRIQESIVGLKEHLERMCDEGSCLASLRPGQQGRGRLWSGGDSASREVALDILAAEAGDAESLLLTKYTAVIKAGKAAHLPRPAHACVHAVVAARLLQRRQLMRCLQAVGLVVWPTWRLLNRPKGNSMDNRAALSQARARAARLKARSKAAGQAAVAPRHTDSASGTDESPTQSESLRLDLTKLPHADVDDTEGGQPARNAASRRAESAQIAATLHQQAVDDDDSDVEDDAGLRKQRSIAEETAEDETDGDGCCSAACHSLALTCSEGVSIAATTSGAVDFLLVYAPQHVLEARAEMLGMRVRVRPQDSGEFLFRFTPDHFERGAPLQPFWRRSPARPYPYAPYFEQFTPVQRQQLTLDLITRARARAHTTHDGSHPALEHAAGGADINFVELMAEGIASEWFPLHHPTAVHGLQKHWVRGGTRFFQLPGLQRVQAIMGDVSQDETDIDDGGVSARGILASLLRNRLSAAVVSSVLTGVKPASDWLSSIPLFTSADDAHGAREAEQAIVHDSKAQVAKPQEHQPAPSTAATVSVEPASDSEAEHQGQALATALQQDSGDDDDDAGVLQLKSAQCEEDGDVAGQESSTNVGVSIPKPSTAPTSRAGSAMQAALQSLRSGPGAEQDSATSSMVSVAVAAQFRKARQRAREQRKGCWFCCCRCKSSCCAGSCCRCCGSCCTRMWDTTLGAALFQPLHLVRGYYGTYLAFYFLFLRTYTLWLLAPAVAGAGVFLAPYFSPTRNTPLWEGAAITQQDGLVAIYALLTVVWATVMLEYVTRALTAAGYTWGVGALGASPIRSVAVYGAAAGSIEDDHDKNGSASGVGGGGAGGAAPSMALRGEFIADMQADDDNGGNVQLSTLEGVFGLRGMRPLHPRRMQFTEQLRRDLEVYNELYFFPASTRRCRYVLSSLAVVFMAGLVVAVVSAVLILPDQLFDSESKAFGVPLASVVSGVANGLVIPIINIMFTKVAACLTRFERHAHQADYDASHVLKRASMQFVNAYLALFIIAFYLQDLQRLGAQLGGILLTGQAIGAVKEFASVWALDSYRRLKNEKVLARLQALFSLNQAGSVGLIQVSRASQVKQHVPAPGRDKAAKSLIRGHTTSMAAGPHVTPEAKKQRRIELRSLARTMALAGSSSDSEDDSRQSSSVKQPPLPAIRPPGDSEDSDDSDADDELMASVAMHLLAQGRQARGGRGQPDRPDGGGESGDGDAAPAPAPPHAEKCLVRTLRTLAKVRRSRRGQVDMYDGMKLNGLHAAVSEVGRQQREDLLDEYLEIVTQFGYVAMFAAAFPLAAAASLLNNLVELRLDAQKALIMRRAFARDSRGIGVWMILLQVISVVSVFTNIMTIFISTRSADGKSRLESAAPGIGTSDVVWALVFGEHIIIALKLFLRRVIPDTPAAVLEDRFRERYYLLKSSDEYGAHVRRGEGDSEDDEVEPAAS